MWNSFGVGSKRCPGTSDRRTRSSPTWPFHLPPRATGRRASTTALRYQLTLDTSDGRVVSGRRGTTYNRWWNLSDRQGKTPARRGSTSERRAWSWQSSSAGKREKMLEIRVRLKDAIVQLADDSVGTSDRRKFGVWQTRSYITYRTIWVTWY